MPRMRFTIGTRFLWNGQVYQIRQKLAEDHLLVENLQFGGQQAVPEQELLTAWLEHHLVFEITGPNTRPTANAPLATEYRITDFDRLPEHQRAEAWRRYQLILPLLRRPPQQRTRHDIAEYARQLSLEQTGKAPSSGHHQGLGKAPVLTTGQSPPKGMPADPVQGSDMSGTPEGKRKRSAIGQAVSAASIERWLRDFERHGSDIRALVPAIDQQGGATQHRLHPKVEEVVQAVLDECAAQPQQRTARHVYYKVVNKLAEENRYRSADDQLRLPGTMTLYRRIHEAGIATILRRQPSPLEAQAGRAVGPGPRAQVSRILERVEIDHTLADVILVDETDRQPIGRPLVTLALDVYSGFPFGLYIGFEDASYLTVMSCLLHGILPKPDCRELYGTRHGWPAYGLPEKLVIDNGKEFVGRDLDDACGQLGIILEPMPARKPWYKGAIERFFGTLNTGLLHSLPGTTYSNTQRRGAYDSAREATISLPAFSRILHKFLLDEYAYRRHRGARGLPAELWAESAKGGFHPDLSWSSEEVTILLGRTAERTIGRRGISFLGLTYHSTGLAALHSALPQGTEVRFKYNPSDLGTIYVADPTGQLGWIAVPAEDTEYTRGLPLWKHRHLRARQAGQGQEDVYVPAEARRQIEAEVAREYQTTRKVRGRKQAARLLGIGTESEPARYTNRAPRPAAEPPPGALAPPLISLNTGDPPAAPAGSPTSGGNRLAQPSPQPAPRTRRRPAAHAADLGSDLAPRQREPAAADPAADQLQTADPPLAPPAPPAPPSGWSGDYKLPSARRTFPRGDR